MLDPKSSALYVPDTDNTHQLAREQRLIVEVGNYLCQVYPGHWWHVECKWAQGYVNIRLPQLEAIFPQMRQVGSGFKFKLLHNPADTKKEAVRAGGLLLEAYDMSRRRKHEVGQYVSEADPEKGGALEFSRFHKVMRKYDIPLIRINGDSVELPNAPRTPPRMDLPMPADLTPEHRVPGA